MADITLYGIRTFGSLIAIALNIVAFTYLQKLEATQCICAEDKNMKFMKFALFFMICYLFVNMFIPIPNVGEDSSVGKMVYMGLQLAVAAGALVYYIFMINYINRLVKEKCKCSEDMRREITYYYAILQMVLFGIMILIALMNGTVFASSPLKTAMDSRSRILDNLADPISALKKTTRDVNRSVLTPIRKSLSPAARGRAASRR